MFEYFFLIIWHVGKPKEPKKGTLKILPQNLNPPPGGPLCDDDDGVKISEGGCPLIESWDDGQGIRGSLAKIAKAQMMGRCSGN